MAVRKRTVAGVLALVAVIGGAVAAWGYASQRWWCPSYAEANRPRTVDEVASGFRENGIPLLRSPRQPVAAATVLRHAADDAIVLAVVCETNRCAPDLDRVSRDRLPVRRGVSFLNVRVWVVASEARAARSLLGRIDSAASALSPSSHDKRCFPD